VNNVDMQD